MSAERERIEQKIRDLKMERDLIERRIKEVEKARNDGYFIIVVTLGFVGGLMGIYC